MLWQYITGIILFATYIILIMFCIFVGFHTYGEQRLSQTYRVITVLCSVFESCEIHWVNSNESCQSRAVAEVLNRTWRILSQINYWTGNGATIPSWTADDVPPAGDAIAPPGPSPPDTLWRVRHRWRRKSGLPKRANNWPINWSRLSIRRLMCVAQPGLLSNWRLLRLCVERSATPCWCVMCIGVL